MSTAISYYIQETGDCARCGRAADAYACDRCGAEYLDCECCGRRRDLLCPACEEETP